MMNGNAVSLWILGAKRTMTPAQIRAHATFQKSVDVDGTEFWGAVLAVLS